MVSFTSGASKLVEFPAAFQDIDEVVVTTDAGLPPNIPPDWFVIDDLCVCDT